MATWKADELTDHVQGNAAVEVPLPARNFAEDVPRKGAAGLVNTIYVPLGLLPSHEYLKERGVNTRRGSSPAQTEIALAGVHDGRASTIDGRHDRCGTGSRGIRKERGCPNSLRQTNQRTACSNTPYRSAPVSQIATTITSTTQDAQRQPNLHARWTLPVRFFNQDRG